jgi:anaerobic selenocysteine-containing dehydrogenase
MTPRDQTTQTPPDRITEYDPSHWPRKVKRDSLLVPTVCFNCESACGLTAFVDPETFEIRKFEGSPQHPGSRGRNCAKGPATLNQITDPERILYPLKRKGRRGSGDWQRVSWDHVLETFAERLHDAFAAKRNNDVCYFVGRPGEDGFAERFLETWGCDGHNSHTNVCSSGGRAGYGFWAGTDRPSPDYANARFILLISAHLESGHYFNPHAQRIIEGQQTGAKIAVIDPRLSNTAAKADYWLAAWPGTEAAVLLAIAKLLLDQDLYDRAFVDRWVNWRTYLAHRAPGDEPTFANFITALKREYADYTPEFAERESGVPAQMIATVAREAAVAGPAFASHIWRAAAAGNLHGWLVTRALMLLNVLTGSVGTEGGVSPNAWHKFIPEPWRKPDRNRRWNELNWPRQYPLAHNEMSILYPHLLLDGAHQPVLFTRVLNPVWTFPDGYSWLRALRDPDRVGLHAALSPTWSETAWWADYVLPMGHGPERHDTHSYETHAGRWLGFRQPVRRVAMERMGKAITHTYEANPGEVWEEGEFWIELSWRGGRAGKRRLSRHHQKQYRPGEKITLSEYYGWMFEHSVPGLPQKARAEGLSPLEYMRRHGAVEISSEDYGRHEDAVGELHDTEIRGLERTVTKRTFNPDCLPLTGRPDTIAADIDDTPRRGFDTPSRKLELYSESLAEFGWEELATPTYARTHVHHGLIDHDRDEYVLIPTYRLPTMIHSRSGSAKYLNELAHTHPLLIHPLDASRIEAETGDLIRIETEIGWFVIKAFVTEGIRPGVVAASHHMGRWRLREHDGPGRWSSALVDMQESGEAVTFRQLQGVRPWKSSDRSSQRIWWSDAGVHQNITFPVHPDPVSGMHCWHQKVRVRVARPGDRYADIHVDFSRAREVYRKWLALARPPTGEYRRPIWLFRPVKPVLDAYRLPAEDREPPTDRPPAHTFNTLVDWSPEAVWGP